VNEATGAHALSNNLVHAITSCSNIWRIKSTVGKNFGEKITRHINYFNWHIYNAQIESVLLLFCNLLVRWKETYKGTFIKWRHTTRGALGGWGQICDCVIKDVSKRTSFAGRMVEMGQKICQICVTSFWSFSNVHHLVEMKSERSVLSYTALKVKITEWSRAKSLTVVGGPGVVPVIGRVDPAELFPFLELEVSGRDSGSSS
jgi:hypothetical protein